MSKKKIKIKWNGKNLSIGVPGVGDFKKGVFVPVNDNAYKKLMCIPGFEGESEEPEPGPVPAKIDKKEKRGKK